MNRILEINQEIDKLDAKKRELLTERDALVLKHSRDRYYCSCVKLNKDIDIWDMPAQEAANRRGLGIGLVGETLSAKKDCPKCHGCGVPEENMV